MACPLIWVQVYELQRLSLDGSISSSVHRTGLKQDSPLLGLQACPNITHSFSAIFQFLDPSFTSAFHHSLPSGYICVASKGTGNLLSMRSKFLLINERIERSKDHPHTSVLESPFCFNEAHSSTATEMVSEVVLSGT